MTMSDIHGTTIWGDVEWENVLYNMYDSDLLALYVNTCNYNPAVYNTREKNAEALETFKLARHCMQGEILRRMRK